MTLEKPVRYRMVGAVVLIFLAVLFLPWLFDGAGYEAMQGLEQPIPERPQFIAPLTPTGPVGVPVERVTDDGSAPPVKQIPEARAYRDSRASEPVGNGSAAVTDGPVEPGNVVASPPAAADSGPALGVGWAVQVGSYRRENNAREQVQALRAAGFPSFVERARADEGTVWRVKVGPRAQRDDALRLRDEVGQRMNVTGIVVAHP